MQAHAQMDQLNSQIAQLEQQLAHSHDKEAQLAQHLQAVTASLEMSQTDSSQAMSDCLELRCQLRDASAQLEQVGAECCYLVVSRGVHLKLMSSALEPS